MNYSPFAVSASSSASPFNHLSAGLILTKLLVSPTFFDSGEAHRFTFRGRRGDELIVAVAFTNSGSDQVMALELWDSFGRLVAAEFQDEGFSLGGLLSGRVLQYNVIQEDTFSLVIVSRENGPSGNYELIVDTFANMLEDSSGGR